MNNPLLEITVSESRGQALSLAIEAHGCIWRGANLTDVDHVSAALTAISSSTIDARFLRAVATDVACLAMGHPHGQAPKTFIGDFELDDAVWRFALSRQYVYVSLVESISGRYLTPA